MESAARFPADVTSAVLQVSAAQAAGGVTAFARPREQPRRVDLAELAELDAAMESGSEGDLEDDFLLTATQACATGGALLWLRAQLRMTPSCSVAALPARTAAQSQGCCQCWDSVRIGTAVLAHMTVTALWLRDLPPSVTAGKHCSTLAPATPV